jgi:hypothetical protein
LAFLKAAAKRMEFSIGTVASSSEWYRKVGGKTVGGEEEAGVEEGPTCVSIE